MKVTELRIGNWVETYTGLLIGYTFSTPKIGNHQIDLKDLEIISMLGHTYRGIPLTPEILKKAGFEYDQHTYAKEYIWLAEGDTGFDIWLSGLANPKHTHVSYLHQLQNLCYCLLGEELEIIL